MPQRISLARARDSLARARESESVREMKKRERKSLFLFIIHDLLIPPRSAHSTRPRLAREEAQNSAPRSIAPGQHLLQTGHGSLSSRVGSSLATSCIKRSRFVKPGVHANASGELHAPIINHCCAPGQHPLQMGAVSHLGSAHSQWAMVASGVG